MMTHPLRLKKTNVSGSWCSLYFMTPYPMIERVKERLDANIHEIPQTSHEDNNAPKKDELDAPGVTPQRDARPGRIGTGYYNYSTLGSSRRRSQQYSSDHLQI